MIQPLWRRVWKFLTKLKIQLPYDPAIPLLGICLEKIIVPKDKRQEFSSLLYRQGKRDTERPHDLSELLRPVNRGAAAHGLQALPLSAVGVTQPLPRLTCPKVSAPVFQG